MGITLNDLTALNTTKVQDNLTLLKQLVQEADATVTTRRGAFHDLVLYFSSLLGTNDQEMVDRALQSLSLLKLSEDPTLADDDLVDATISNYRLTRQEAASAQGTIQLILDSATVFTIPLNFPFVANGQVFLSDEAYTGRLTEDEVIDDTDRLITDLGNDLFGVLIEATAQDTGIAGNITRGTQLIPSQHLSTALNSAVAYTDFTGGTAEETNAELYARQLSGAGLKAWSNRMTNEALLLEQFPDNVVALSIVGFGDDEMSRDQHSLWPGSMGGKNDVYLRTQLRPGSTLVSVTASLVSKVGALGTWQFSLARDDAPGFYEIAKIAQAGAIDTQEDGYALTYESRSFNVTGTGSIPDITTAEEAAYSRYQTGTFRFNDTDIDASPYAVSDTREYDVEVTTLPVLDEIQDYLNDRSVQLVDVLVKTPVPCFVTLTLTVQISSSLPELDEDVIAAAAADAINGTGFSGVLTASTIAAAVVPELGGGAVTALSMTGRIRRPDGTTVTLAASSNALTVPDDPDNYVSERTVNFFCAPADVAVTVVTV